MIILYSLTGIDFTIINLIIASFTGALFGEALREANDNIPIVFSKFIAEFAAGGFVALMIGLALKELLLKDKPLIDIAITGFLGFSGRKKSVDIMEKILNSIMSGLSKTGKDDKEGDEKDNKKDDG